MRKLVLVVIAPFMVATAAFAAPLGVAAQASPDHPGWSSPRARALSPAELGAPAAARPTTSSSVACDAGFDPVASPNSTPSNYLFATAAITPNDVWAVGISNVSSTTPDKTLAEHWDGTSWTIVPTPNPGLFSSDLNGVAAISTNDVWAVGDYVINASGYVSTFAEHWNGTTWTLYTSTQNPMNYNFLFAVNAVSSSDVWAVGSSWSAGYFTLVEHWNGTTWSALSSPNQGFNGGFASNQLFSVSASSSSDVWAVGSFRGTTLQSLAEHWDGANWTLVTTPNVTGDNEILSVNALESGRAVGVGYGNFVSGGAASLGEAWDLSTSVASTQATESGPGSGDTILEGLDRSGPSVWAVGFSRATLTGARQTLAIPATWNSTSHSLTWGSPGTSANPSNVNSVLYAVAAASPYAYWAAGYSTNGSVNQTLTESYCALHLGLNAPASTQAGAPFSVTVTAQNGNGTTATGYLGTVHFTSNDPAATLPADYMFTLLDMGVHTFNGVVLRTPPCSRTITTSDIAMPLSMPATATLAVQVGVCQGPGGSASARGARPGPGGTASGRTGVNQSGGATPGPRSPRLGPAVDSRPGATTSPAAATAIPTAPHELEQPVRAAIRRALLAAHAVYLTVRLWFEL